MLMLVEFCEEIEHLRLGDNHGIQVGGLPFAQFGGQVVEVARAHQHCVDHYFVDVLFNFLRVVFGACCWLAVYCTRGSLFNLIDHGDGRRSVLQTKGKWRRLYQSSIDGWHLV